jgi:SAM-dependent methyltransferase
MTDRPTPALAASGSLSRSIQLFRAFQVEQTDPDYFYSLLARDSIREVQRWCPLDGASVLDVGGGPGYFADAFTSAGARYAGVDPDAGELTARGGVAGNTMRASGLCLPFANGAFDLTYSSNVLEHVPDPEGMVAEMVRVTRPGGTVVVSWTPWLSPLGRSRDLAVALPRGSASSRSVCRAARSPAEERFRPVFVRLLGGADAALGQPGRG